ncbi:MAG: septum formation initiator family protein [Clostridiales bacterium]|nr:septum formation initiator family protein [Clostridiales bacterium]
MARKKTTEQGKGKTVKVFRWGRLLFICLLIFAAVQFAQQNARLRDSSAELDRSARRVEKAQQKSSELDEMEAKLYSNSYIEKLARAFGMIKPWETPIFPMVEEKDAP